MQKEQLVKHLDNQPLIAAIRQKMEIDGTHKELRNAHSIAILTRIPETAIYELNVKCAEYSKISKAYSNLIEDVWGVTWQNEEIIKRYIDSSDDELDKLPSVLRL